MSPSSAALPGLDRSPGSNWVDRLPAPLAATWHRSWIYRAAQHLAHEKGMTVGHAIAVAVNAARKGCATGDLNWSGAQSVNPKSRAEMCAAVATWNAMKAAAKTDTSIPADQRRAVELAFARVERHALELSAQRDSTWERLGRRLHRAIYGPPIDLAPSAAERKRAESKGAAMPGGRFPIRNRAELAKAIRAVGRATDPSGEHSEAERRKVRRFVIARAKVLGALDQVPSTWAVDGSLKS